MLNYSYNPKPIEELTFTDDGMFQAVLHEPDICAELVERLLHVKVGHVEYPEIEKQIAPYYTSVKKILLRIKTNKTMDYLVIHLRTSVLKTVM